MTGFPGQLGVLHPYFWQKNEILPEKRPDSIKKEIRTYPGKDSVSSALFGRNSSPFSQVDRYGET